MSAERIPIMKRCVVLFVEDAAFWSAFPISEEENEFREPDTGPGCRIWGATC
jgi:hypothetical protein